MEPPSQAVVVPEQPDSVSGFAHRCVPAMNRARAAKPWKCPSLPLAESVDRQAPRARQQDAMALVGLISGTDQDVGVLPILPFGVTFRASSRGESACSC